MHSSGNETKLSFMWSGVHGGPEDTATSLFMIFSGELKINLQMLIVSRAAI